MSAMPVSGDPPGLALHGLRIGGLTPFSTVDCPGRLAAVVFVQGCPWRCVYCHNPHLQARDGAPASAPDWAGVRAWLEHRVGLLDMVVFSGGEPTADPALPQAVADVRRLGFGVGLHTAGSYTRRLQALLPDLDWVGLDVKAPLNDDAAHERITGLRGGAAAVQRSLALLVDSGIDFECRTTAHPALLDDAALRTLAGGLAAAGVERWALQIYRREGSLAALPDVAADYPAPATLTLLRQRFAQFTVRRA